MTLRELRDALDKTIARNEESRSSVRNHSPVVIVLRQSTKKGVSKRYFPIYQVPDYLVHLGEGVPIEYREPYTIQAQEEDEIDNP